jgi:hypothetical protein
LFLPLVSYPVLIKLKSLKRFAARITQTRAALVSILTVLALGGCATAYHEDNAVNRFFIEPGGYGVSDLGEDRYQVWFVANRHTSRETMQAYWLRRCAELTLEKGFDVFEARPREALAGAGGYRHVAAKFIYIPMYSPSGSGPPMQGYAGEITLRKMPFVPHPPDSFDARALDAALRKLFPPQCEGGNVCPHDKTYLRDRISNPAS